VIVCSCKAVSDRRVREAIAAGAHTVVAVTRVTGAGSGCGMCRRTLHELIVAERRRAAASGAPSAAAEPHRDAAG